MIFQDLSPRAFHHHSPALTQATGLSEKQIRNALEALGDKVSRGGKGVKRDPYTYRRATPDSIPSQPHPMGEETNSATRAAEGEAW